MLEESVRTDPTIEAEVAEPYQEPHDGGSLTDDITALYEDGKTYAQAELAYQKTRARFTVDKGKMGAIFLGGALTLLLLAGIALVVGLVIALTPLITAWGATAVVVALLVIGALILGGMAKKKFTTMASAYKDDGR